MEVRRLSWGEVVRDSDDIAPFLRLVLARDIVPLYTPEDILNEAYSGQRQIWTITDEGNIVGVIGTRITVYPLARAVVMDIAAMSREVTFNWDWFEKPFRKFAKENECTVAFLWGRKGWERVMRKHGMQVDVIALGIEL